MNNVENETIFRNFFTYLHADDDNQKELSNFIKDNYSVLTNHLTLMYSIVASDLYWSSNLVSYFYIHDSKDTFKQKMIFINNNYQELYYALVICSTILYSANAKEMIDHLDTNEVELSKKYKKLEKKQSSLSENIDDQKKIIESQKEIINKQKNSLNKTTTKIDNIYSEFVAILGIFTAITFAIFGGMNLLTDLFKNIGSTPASLGQTLILAAIFGLIMWGIIELLFYWISKIKGITDSTKDKNKTYFNWLAIGVLVIILILGILLFTKAIK